MTIPRRFKRVKSVLDRRQPDLTVLMERVHKPHNFSAILRTGDAVGLLEAHAVRPEGEFEARRHIASGTGKWIEVHVHDTLEAAVDVLHGRGLQLIAAHPSDEAVDYRTVDYTRPSALLMGTELFGLTNEAVAAADQLVEIPMAGFGASLNVSVAAAVLLYEAQRQRAAAGMYDESRLDPERYRRVLFEWAYPQIADYCRRRDAPYPRLGPDGELLDPLP